MRSNKRKQKGETVAESRTAVARRKNPYRFLPLKFFVLSFLISFILLSLLGLPLLLVSGEDAPSTSSSVSSYTPDWNARLNLLTAIPVSYTHLIYAEQFGVRTAWHGPGDVSPVGHACNVHLDLASSNFGIQEWSGFTPLVEEMFPGCPQLKDGYAYVSDRPGWGIDLNEELAAQYPPKADVVGWTQTRLVDGTFQRP